MALPWLYLGSIVRDGGNMRKRRALRLLIEGVAIALIILVIGAAYAIPYQRQSQRASRQYDRQPGEYNLAIPTVTPIHLPSSLPTAAPSYPTTFAVGIPLPCASGCLAAQPMSTVLKSVTIRQAGTVDLAVTYINTAGIDFDIVFDPPDALTDASGHVAFAYAPVEDEGALMVPATGSIDYVISFDGLSPAPGTECVFSSDVKASKAGVVFTMYFADVSVPCR
jgi:hypothetical protein